MSFYSRYILPHFIDFGLSRSFIMAEREKALAPVVGEVLEIGFGTGLNLSVYPSAVARVTGLDPQPMLRRRVARRIAAARMPVELVFGDAASLPFPRAKFDSVVSTYTLCSVADVGRTLAEVCRVLRPGGKFYFLEHGRSADPAIARRQDRWNGVQRVLGGGCNLNRPMDQLIAGHGLNLEVCDRYVQPELWQLAGTMYRGIAGLRQ